jgi:hypothetical protein
VKHFCFIHINFCYNKPFFTFMKQMRDFERGRRTRVARRSWRIAGLVPSEDAQSSPKKYLF